MEFADKTLVCRECGSEFIFTAGEQEFYQSKGLLNQPSRCPNCRANRRRGDRSSGGGGEGGGQRRMYPAVCANCGAQTEVPFEPYQGKPVYCTDCYSTIRSTR